MRAKNYYVILNSCIHVFNALCEFLFKIISAKNEFILKSLEKIENLPLGQIN